MMFNIRSTGLVFAAAMLFATEAFGQFWPFGSSTPPAPPAAEAPSAEPEPAPAAPAAPAPAAKPQAPRRLAHPLPPRRPAGLGSEAPAAGEPAAREQTAANQGPALITPAKAAQDGAIPANPQAALARVNAFLNGYDTITGNFVQFNQGGARAEGTIYIQRPGRLRFKYEPPSTLEVVADGRSVAVRDKKLGTNDVYSIGQTPLKFLLKDRIDLASDTRLQNVAIEPSGIVRIALEDSSTLGGTSKITLLFDSKANELKQWTIVDAQGYRTQVSLYNLKISRRADPASAPQRSALERLFEAK